MPNPQLMTRRSFFKKGLALAGSLFAAGGLTAGYSAFVEPRRYEIMRHTLRFKRLPEAFHGIKLLQFSDTHIGHHFNLGHLQKVVDLIAREQADLLCFTGDLFDTSVTEDPAATSEILSQLEAPLGKWAVLGNHDKYSGVKKTEDMLAGGGFTTLVNRHQTIRHKDGFIQIAGVADMLTGNPDIAQTLKGADSGAFTLLMSHSPNFADKASKQAIDLQLSGHTHGGQIRLPFIGALVTPPLGDKYVMGHYTAAGSEMQVYTTRGIGTTLMPMRFLCRPEITVLTLEKQKP